MHRRRTTLLVLVSSAAIAGGLTIAPAHAAPEENLIGPDNTLAIEDYAQENATSAALAEAAIADQDLVVRLINDRDIELGQIADIWFDQSATGQQLHVRSQDQTVKEAMARLALSATKVVVHDGAPVAAAVPKLTDAVEAAVRKDAPGVQGLYVRPDNGSLIIETTDAVSDVDTSRLPTATGFDKVVVEQVPAASDTILARGGVKMNGCTAGFSARNGSSYIGVFSAAHCGTSRRVYTNTAGTGSYVSASRTLKNWGANADIGFYKIPSGNYVSSSFYGSSSSSATSMSSPQDVPEGITVCHRGRPALGWDCGSITSITYRPTWSGACPNGTCNAVFVRVGGAPTSGGDSGGPWVNGNHPIGIHKGGASGSGGWSVYSKVSRIPSATSLYY